MKDGKIIQLNIIYLGDENFFSFSINDSFLILPNSLRKLAKSFNVDCKSYFPYEFVNSKDIDLNYIGSIPTFDL
jgi:hypothetical protein